ncbi:hypothetical protein INT43_008950 [Umbelopsis isabellina]|uniref:Uncharacterized protein n=1 Tax=Mortierella isabellina TaxID=91625 RepID=A0A8H7PW30_MORIS|nr:hypothetical protein INT43_008950 [Umbelopsis isabellina]
MKFSTVPLLFLGLAASITATSYEIFIQNKAGDILYLDDTGRQCQCLSKTQTQLIANSYGGIVRVFASTDCTGAYDNIGSGDSISNAEWVNSVSFGASGSSSGPYGCPNLFA